MQHGHAKLTPELMLEEDVGVVSDDVASPFDHEFKLLAPLLINKLKVNDTVTVQAHRTLFELIQQHSSTTKESTTKQQKTPDL